MLTSVLDADITQKVVRLGSRSTDERIAQYTLKALEERDSATRLDRSMKRQYAMMKELEEDMRTTMTAIRLPCLDWNTIEDYLDIHFPEHADMFRQPPFWIQELATLMWNEEDVSGKFVEQKGKKGKKKAEVVDDSIARTFYGLWRIGVDVAYIQTPPSPPPKDGPEGKEKAKEASAQQSLASTPPGGNKDIPGNGGRTSPRDGPEQAVTTASDQEELALAQQQDAALSTQQVLLRNPPAFFESLGYGGRMPEVPSKNRALRELLRFANVWSM